MYKTSYSSICGEIFIISDGYALKGLWFSGQKNFPYKILNEAKTFDNLGIFKIVKSFLNGYFKGETKNFSGAEVKPDGTQFRKEIWKILLSIPYGGTITYGELAKKYTELIGIKNMSAQAVGGAVAHNPISIIIPCHRVIGINQKLTGYAGGLEIKRKLLNIEGHKI